MTPSPRPARPARNRQASNRQAGTRLAGARLAEARLAEARQLAESVPDPELPMVTVADLGILRDVRLVDGGSLVVTITPTYSGCPALTEIARALHGRLTGAGLGPVDVRTVLAPAWTTDWITDEGRRKLSAAGVAPPGQVRRGPVPLTLTRSPAPEPVLCPQCGSPETAVTAAFSGTACKALHRCRACGEPFEAVKAL